MKRKIVKTIISLCMMICVMGFSVYALIYPEGYTFHFDLNFTPSEETLFEFGNDGETLYLTDYGKKIKSIEIPSTFNGKPVKNIIFNTTKLETIIFPDDNYEIVTLAFNKLPDVIGVENLSINEREGSVFYLSDDSYVIGSWQNGIFIETFSVEVFSGDFENLGVLQHILPGRYFSIIVPEGVTNISDCFYNCFYLMSVALPSSLTSIGDSAFNGCTNLTDVIIPEGIREIGSNCFSACINLINIRLPQSLEFIGDYAFYGCSSLEKVTVLKVISDSDDAPHLGYDVFTDCNPLLRISVPVASLFFYQNAQGWNDYSLMIFSV